MNEWLPIIAIVISVVSMFITVISTVIVIYGRLSAIERDIKWMCKWLKLQYGDSYAPPRG